MRATLSAAELRKRVGQEIGVSHWIEVDQPRIDLFAEATLDRQFIHVDPVRASETGFGGTIAHGFLVLSLLSRMWEEASPTLENAEMALNYGLNRMRFIAPVKSGERVRGRFALRDVAEKQSDQVMLTYDVTVEIAEGPKPALVAEWLVLSILRPGASAR